MKKFTVFSDLQVHNYKKFDVKGSRLNNCLEVFNDVFEFNHNEGIDLCLFIGDLYDSQKDLPTVVVNSVVNRLSTLFKKYPEQRLVAISGNHDYATKNLIDKPAETALQHLAEIFPGRFILLDNKIKFFQMDGVDLFIQGIPYYEYKEHYQTRLEQSKEELSEYIHEMYSDGGYGPNPVYKTILLIHQTPEHSNAMIPFDTKVEDPLYKNYDLILCGHIHKHEVLKQNFIIVGSPIHRDLSDAGQDKGFMVYDDASDLDSFEIIYLDKYPKYKQERNPDPDSTDYVIPIIEIEDSPEVEVQTKQFVASNKREDLVENYWNEVGEGNENLLKLGLKFIS